MFVQARRITEEEAKTIGEDMRLAPEEIEAMVEAARQSDPALVLTADDRPFVVCGFIPRDAFGSSCYAWMQWTSEIYDRPIAATRKCLEVFGEMRKKYTRIYGHCSYGDRPVRLLTRMGAKFWTGPDGRPTYVIED